MKGCKLTDTHARMHAQTHTHTEVDFSLQFVLADYAGFFYVSNDKGVINNIEQCFDSCFTKLKQYEQLPEKYNSSVNMHWDLLPSSI